VFALVLAHSRYLFIRVVMRLDETSWLECHVAGFAFLGGAPRRLVIDNLGDGVLQPDLYDPALNRSYQQFADHYGTLIDPCRVAHPKDKPRVERILPYVRDSFWAGRDFLSLEEINAAALIWCRDVAGRRLHGTTRQRPRLVFETVEAPALLPLPADPFELATWGQAKVHADCHAHVAGALYSVPFRHVGRTLDVRLSANRVQFYWQAELVKTHVRVPKGRRQTDGTDYPPEQAAFYQHTPDWCRDQAALLGPGVRAVVATLLESHALHYLRQGQGIIRLADKYGAARLDAACQRALDFGDPAYRTIRTILAQGLDAQPVLVPVTPPAPPAYLRGADELFAAHDVAAPEVSGAYH
jgi:hypothetical protein